MKIKPTWFSDTNYIADKLVQLKALGYEGATIESVTEAITGAGGAWNHYELWGYKESYPSNNVVNYLDLKDASGNVVFNTQLYCESKLASLQLSPEYAAVYKTWQNVADMFAAMNLSPYDHFVMNGAAEGLTISSTFNANNYFVAKLQSLIKADPQTYTSWSTAQLAKYFADHNVDPYQNFVTNGAAEGITAAQVAPTGGQGGQTYDLTTGQDNLVGTTGNDYFYAYATDDAQTLNSGDRIDGGAGRDTLEADLIGNGNSASGLLTTPITNGVEVVKFNSRSSDGSSGAGNFTHAKVDAERMHGVEEFWSTKSRYNVGVEDVITDSNKMTSVFQSSDPGSVDFKVTFNSQNLRPIEGTTTGKLSLELIDGQGAAASPSTPLLDNAYDTIIFHYNNKQYTVQFDVVKGATATYDQLMAAMQKGINANAELKAGGVTAAITGDFVFFNRTGQQVTGKTITLSSATGPLEALTGDGWKASGTLPPANNLSADMKGASSTTCPLIQTNIGLDNVGSIQWDDTSADCLPDNAIFGSRSGDMVVGGAGGRDGVERFDIKADRGSWLNSLSSTNNTLRMINLTSGDWNGDGVAGISATKGGQVFIGGFGKNTTAAGPNDQVAWQDRGRVLNMGTAPQTTAADAQGIWDVKQFDATGYTGNISIAAQFTADAYDKYMKDVDGLKTVYSNFAPSGDFQYTFGTGDDTLNMKVNGGIVADRDFVLNMNMGDGNDYVNFNFDFKTANQVVDQAGSFTTGANNNGTYTTGVFGKDSKYNVNIDTGAGDDVVHTWGNATVVGSSITPAGNDQTGAAFAGTYGAVNMKTGDGKNVVYAAQASGVVNKVWILNANSTAAADRAVLVTTVGEAQPLNNDAQSTLTKWTPNVGGKTANGEYTVKATISFLGITTEVEVGKYKVPAAGSNYEVSASDLNSAIMKAINTHDVLSNLLVVKDGAGNSLIVESLIDGMFVDTNALGITFTDKISTATTWDSMTFADQKAGSTASGANTGYLQEASNNGGADITGDDHHYYGYTNIEGGADADILVTGYADAYVKAGAGNDTIIVGNETYNKITGGTGADAIHLGYLTANSATSLGNNTAAVGAYDIVHQAKGDSGTVTSSLAVNTTANSIATTSFDVIYNFDKVDTNVGDHLVLDSYAYSATSNPTFGAMTETSTWDLLKTYVTGNTNNNAATWVQGNYNAVTGTFAIDAATGKDAFLVYDSDASAGVQFEGVVLVGQGAMASITGTAPVNAGDVGFLTIA